jgi:2-isopropylmalate synthase
VEGCLFGCGERTGNVDLIALGMNMFSQGIDPKMDLSDMKSIIEVSEYCTELPVPARMPWSGSLAYTAFSGSHQDAVKKGMDAMTPGSKWEVPYLPIDPTDIGCNYDAVIRVNSQSGKGGCAWVIERELGITLPKPVQADVSKVVQKETDRTSKEIMPEDLCQLFKDTYLVDGAITLKSLEFSPANGEPCALKAGVSIQGKQTELSGSGAGLDSAFASALSQAGYNIKTKAFTQSAKLQKDGESPETVTSVLVEWNDGTTYGVGVDQDASRSGIQAILSALNRRM